MVSTLVLLRHAETAAAPGTVVGHTNVPLSAAGHAAAANLAQAVADNTETGILRPTAIISSDLRRAVDTARPLADALGLSLVTDPRLRELDFGDWEGRTWDALHAEQPERLAAWGDDWVNTAPPGGEPFSGLIARSTAWLAEIAEARSTTLVVAHAGTIRALLCHALGLPASSAFDFAVQHLQPTMLRRQTPDRWALHRLNGRRPD